MKTTVAPILLFDGVCNLCQGTVQFVIERDKKATVQFASLQSDFALQQFAKFGIPAQYLDSIVLIENERISYKSSAALRLCSYLDGLWPAMRVFILDPKTLARFRLRLGGTQPLPLVWQTRNLLDSHTGTAF
jgi:predicted DCC family thiol-disulfide oxidoreductase YuxK